MAKYTVVKETITGTHEIKQTNDINGAAKYAQGKIGYGHTIYVRDNETGKRMTATCQSCLADYPDSVDLEWYGE